MERTTEVAVMGNSLLNGYSIIGDERPNNFDEIVRISTPTLVLEEICHVLDLPTHQINLGASFAQHGGHSLTALALASGCKRRGVALSVESILRSPTIQDLLLSALPLDRSLDRLDSSTPSDNTASHRPETTPTTPDAIELDCAHLPILTGKPRLEGFASVTEMQSTLIHTSQEQPGTNVISFFETHHTQNLPAIRKAWRAVIEAEPIFRTAFQFSAGSARLVPQSQASFTWIEIITEDQGAYERELSELENETNESINRQVTSSFKVVTLWKGSGVSSISTVIWRVHHALIDGYSARLVHRKVHEAAAGKTVHPGTAFTLVARELELLQREERIKSQAFWKAQESNCPLATGDLALPKPILDDVAVSGRMARVTFQFPADKLSSYARQVGVSVASLFVSAWALTMALYSDSDAVLFGVIFSGRSLPLVGADDTIGPLINTLPLRVSLDPSLKTAEFLLYIFNRIIELGSFQFSPPEDGYKRTFSSALAMEFAMETSEASDIQCVGDSYFETTSSIPLNIFFREDGHLRLCYHKAAYYQKDIEALGESVHRSLSALLDPDLTVDQCMANLVSPEAREKLLRMGNCYSPLTTVHSVTDNLITLFEKAVADFPTAIAIESGSEHITYRQMQRRVEAVQITLSRCTSLGDVVCVHADRSINWIIAIYGILKAGRVYCALDSAMSSTLRDINFASAGAQVFLTPAVSDSPYKPSSCSMHMSVEDILKNAFGSSTAESKVVESVRPDPSATAYICFTSGSTGKPKGVVCTHGGLVAFQRDLEIRLFAKPGIKISQLMSPAFDGSIHEIFSALSYGATLVLASPSDPFVHLSLVNSAILTPSIAKVLEPQDFPSLETVS